VSTGPCGTDAPTPAHDGGRTQCSACGEPLTAGANYCPRCGQPTGAPLTPGQEAPAAAGLGPEFGPPFAATTRAYPIPLHRRRPLQIAAVAAVIAVGAIVFAIASTGSSHKSPGTVVGADGVTTYKAGHFSAKFPSTPEETQVPGAFANYRFVVHLAIARAPSVEAVEEEDYTPSITTAAMDAALRETMASFGASSGMTLVSQSVTAFQGHVARHGAFSSTTGQQFDVVAFFLGDNREYVIVAPSGSSYDDLAASFTSLP
jgi:hypothetical protein